MRHTGRLAGLRCASVYVVYVYEYRRGDSASGVFVDTRAKKQALAALLVDTRDAPGRSQGRREDGHKNTSV